MGQRGLQVALAVRGSPWRRGALSPAPTWCKRGPWRGARPSLRGGRRGQHGLRAPCSNCPVPRPPAAGPQEDRPLPCPVPRGATRAPEPPGALPHCQHVDGGGQCRLAASQPGPPCPSKRAAWPSLRVEAASPVAVEMAGLRSASLVAQTWRWEGPEGPWAFPGPLWAGQPGPCLPRPPSAQGGGDCTLARVSQAHGLVHRGHAIPGTGSLSRSPRPPASASCRLLPVPRGPSCLRPSA